MFRSPLTNTVNVFVSPAVPTKFIAGLAFSVTVLMPRLEQVNVFGVSVRENKQLSVLTLFTNDTGTKTVPLTPRLTVVFLHLATGGVWSFSVTVKLQLLALPRPSLAVNVTSEVALWPVSIVLAGGVWVTVIEPASVQLSLREVGDQAPTVPEQVPFAGMFWLAGQVIDGAWVSFTVTVNAQVAVLLAPSVTLKVFVVVPTGNEAPEARPAIWSVVGLEQLSVPEGVV